MKQRFVLVAVAALTLVGCGKNEPAPPETQAKPAQSTSSDGYLGTITKAQQGMVGKVDVVAIDAAIQRFQVDQGRNPNDLNELVAKKYLTQLPTPPVGKS